MSHGQGPRLIGNIEPTWGLSAALTIGSVGFITFITTLFLVGNFGRKFLTHLAPFQRSNLSALLSLLATCTLLAPLVLLIARKLKLGKWWASIEWNPDGQMYWSFFAGAAFAVIFQIVLKTALGSAGSFDEYPIALSFGLYVLSVVLLQAVVEEIYFRGILFLALAKRLGNITAIAFVTVIFVFMHPLHRLYVLPPAIMLGWARLRTRSVASCFAFHASYNLFLALYQLLAPS